jgi:hypothetical protein
MAVCGRRKQSIDNAAPPVTSTRAHANATFAVTGATATTKTVVATAVKAAVSTVAVARVASERVAYECARVT